MSLCDLIKKIFPENKDSGVVDDLFQRGENMSFEICLAETIAWCQPRASQEDIRNPLRSSDLQPDLFNNNRVYMVRQIVQHRTTLTQHVELPSITKHPLLAGGKLLVYFPDEQLCEGASELASKGFFDVYDAPPWDTWVGVYHDTRGLHLVAWVPPELIGLAEEGIYVNSTNCIDWLSNVNVELSRKLRERGLID